MEVIRRLLKPDGSTLKADTNELNKCFNKTATKILSSQSYTKQELERFINLCSNKDDAFQLQPLSCESFEKCLKLLRNDCYTGYDHIPISFIKPVAEFLLSPMTLI